MNEMRQDRQTVTPDGVPVAPVPHGVTFRPCVTHIDDRGAVCEMFDPHVQKPARLVMLGASRLEDAFRKGRVWTTSISAAAASRFPVCVSAP